MANFIVKILRKIITSVILVSFCGTFIVNDAKGIVIVDDNVYFLKKREKLTKTLDVKTFSISPQLGTIKYINKTDSDKVVFHIQDAHCNYKAQKKIRDIIDYLNSEYGVEIINLEGGAGDYELEVFTDIYEKNVRSEVVDYFVRWGRVNGAEDYAVNNPGKVVLWGLENPDLYMDNLNVYRESLSYKTKALKMINYLDRLIKKLSVNIFSDDLLNLSIKYAQYKKGNIDLRKFLVYLAEKAKTEVVEIRGYPDLYLLFQSLSEEDSVNFKKANSQREEMIKTIEKNMSIAEARDFYSEILKFRNGIISTGGFYEYLLGRAKKNNIDINNYPDLQKYIIYISLYDAADKSGIMRQIDDFEKNICLKLFENEQQKQLYYMSKNIVLLRNMFDFKLIRYDFDRYIENIKDFDTSVFTGFIKKYGSRYNIETASCDSFYDLDDYRERIIKFYELSFKRDEVFIDNMRLSGRDVRTGIIVSGGFHTESILELLSGKSISYVSIVPNFKNEKGYESPYFNILSGGRSPLEKSVKAVFSLIQVPSLLNKLGFIADTPEYNAAFRTSVDMMTTMVKMKRQPFVIKLQGNRYIVFDKDVREAPIDILDADQFNKRYISENHLPGENIIGGTGMPLDQVKGIFSKTLPGGTSLMEKTFEPLSYFEQTGMLIGISPVKDNDGMEYKIDYDIKEINGIRVRDYDSGLFVFARKPGKDFAHYTDKNGDTHLKRDNEWQKYRTPDNKEMKIRYSEKFKNPVSLLRGAKDENFSVLKIRPCDVESAIAKTGGNLNLELMLGTVMEAMWKRVLGELNVLHQGKKEVKTEPDSIKGKRGEKDIRIKRPAAEGKIGVKPTGQKSEEEPTGGKALEIASKKKKVPKKRIVGLKELISYKVLRGHEMYTELRDGCLNVLVKRPPFYKRIFAGIFSNKTRFDYFFDLFEGKDNMVSMPAYILDWIYSENGEAINKLDKLITRLDLLYKRFQNIAFMNSKQSRSMLRVLLYQAGKMEYDRDGFKSRDKNNYYTNVLNWSAEVNRMLRNLKTTPTREGYMTKNILEDTIDKFYNLGKSPNNVMLLKYIVQNAKRSQYLASLTKIMGWLDYGDTLDLLVDIENPENQLRKILKNEDFLLAVDFGGEEAKELKFDPGRRDYFEVFRGVKPLEAFNRMLEEYDRYKQNVLDLDDTQRFKDIYMFIRGFIAQYRRHYGITKDILFATYKTTGLSSSWKPLGNLENPVTILNTTSWDLLSPNFLDFSISAESKYKINFVGASGLIDIEADPWREAKLRDKKIYLLRTPSRGGIKNIVGETIAGKITEDKGGIEGAEGSIIPASGILARMESGYAILFDHTPEYSEIEDYLDIIVSLEEAKEFTPLSFSSISKGNKGLVIPGDLKLPVEESPYEFVVSSFETEKEHLDRGKRIIDAREREGVIVLTKDKPEAFMSEGDVVYVRETEDSMDSRLSYTLKDGEFAATGIILSNRKYREEAQTHFDSLKGNIEIRNEEDLIRLRIAQKKKEDINNFMKYLDYLKKNPDKRKIEKIPENEREKEKYFKNKNLEILGIDKLPPDKKEAKAVLSRAKKRLLKIYYDVTGRDEYLGRIATRINGAADYLGDMIEKRESEGDADSGNDQQDNGGGLIGKLFNFDGELLVSGFDVKLDAARGQVRMNHYDKSGEKDMKEVSLTLADDMKNFSSEDLTNILSTWLLSTRNPLMKKKPRDRILKQARNLIKSMGKIKSVKVIEENPEVRGYLSDDGVLYLSRYLAENPMALLHELGEKYAVLPEGYPDLSRHTYMRGAGKDLRRAYSALVKEKGVRAVNSLDLNDFISAIEKKMDELGMRSERKGQGQSLITASEKDLMRYNYDNRGAYYDVKERNKLLFYGFQDNLDPARNTVFTSEIKELNQNLKGGLNIVLVRTSNPATASRITELSRKMSRKYKKNKLNTEVLCYHDADSLKKQMEKAYEIALKNRELWPKISVDCNMPGDLGAAKEFIENISAQDDRKMFITLKDFLPGNPDEHMIAINKIIPVAALLSGIKRRQDDFKEKPEEIAFLIRERMLFLRNSGFFSEIEGSRIDFEKMSDSELLEFTDQLVTGEILVTITQIDLEEIPRWYETQKAIESSV